MAVLKIAALGIALGALVAGCRFGPEQWGPLRGQVVDAETGTPLAGAHVMALWTRERPALHDAESFYDARETLTGQDGRFDIPWEARFLTAFVGEPRISIFAPGYLIQPPEVTPPDGRRYVDPTVVRMRPLKTREEQCKFEPLGVIPDAIPYVPRLANAQYDYRMALQCAQLR